MRLYGIYGASGFGREVMPLARQQLASEVQDSELVFIDDGAGRSHVMNGHRVLSFEEFLAEKAIQRFAAIAIADAVIRARLAERLTQQGVDLFSIRATNAVVLDANDIGDGAILCSFVNITSNATIGRCFHANIYSYVAHDCVIGDFVTFAPGVQCNGNVVVEDNAYVGTGAILKQGSPGNPLVIGRGAVVGMGAVVTRSVPAGVTVVGNPAKPLVKS